ncbi:MAG: Asp-tRNA(Asn)/Glu-tRNA(Gln) amidotransferase subunit GatB [Erysipelotrichaceae bacterium]
MKYEVVIGIEIHCELKTKTKMFSSAPLSFASLPNSCVNEVDIALPGTLPCLNKYAVELAIRACTAMNCKIDSLIKFDRKNYYYSDLPKGYQITQQFHPIGSNGSVNIPTDNGAKAIRIERIHMEEDTAKQFHNFNGTLIDFNRAGTPLIEIVSKPDIRSAKEATSYIEMLRTALYYLGVSDVKMEEGSMRCDINISMREVGTTTLGTRTEIKNLNSISNVSKAIESEIERQTKILEEGGKVTQETRRFDEASRSTVAMRLKEGNVDYKYFPEPNIPPIQLSEEFITKVIEELPQLPSERKNYYINECKLSTIDADILVNNKELSDFYNSVIKHTNEYKLAANWTITELNAALNKMNIKVVDNPLNPEYLAEMINMVTKGEISSKQAKIVFEEMMLGKEPHSVVEAKGMKQMSDEASILNLIATVLDNNAQSILDFKAGKDRAVGFLVGQVMKASKGQANPALTSKLIVEELKKR